MHVQVKQVPFTVVKAQAPLLQDVVSKRQRGRDGMIHLSYLEKSVTINGSVAMDLDLLKRHHFFLTTALTGRI